MRAKAAAMTGVVAAAPGAGTAAWHELTRAGYGSIQRLRQRRWIWPAGGGGANRSGGASGPGGAAGAAGAVDYGSDASTGQFQLAGIERGGCDAVALRSHDGASRPGLHEHATRNLAPSGEMHGALASAQKVFIERVEARSSEGGNLATAELVDALQEQKQAL